MKAADFFFIRFSHSQLLSFTIVWQCATFLEPTSQNSAIQKIKYGQFVEASVKENQFKSKSYSGELSAFTERTNGKQDL